MDDHQFNRSLALVETLSKGERTRLRILENAIRSLTKRGLEECSFAVLAKDAKVHQSLFVHYFGSKEVLLDEALNYVLGLGARYTDWFLGQKDSVEDKITQYLAASFSWFEVYPVHARFFFLCLQRSSYHAGMRLRFGRHFESAHLRIEKILTSQAVPTGIALAIHSLVVGILVNTCARPQSKQIAFLADAKKSAFALWHQLKGGSRLPAF